MEKNQLIHIATEGVIVIGMAVYFARQNTALTKHIKDLIERVEKLEAQNTAQDQALNMVMYRMGGDPRQQQAEQQQEQQLQQQQLQRQQQRQQQQRHQQQQSQQRPPVEKKVHFAQPPQAPQMHTPHLHTPSLPSPPNPPHLRGGVTVSRTEVRVVSAPGVMPRQPTMKIEDVSDQQESYDPEDLDAELEDEYKELDQARPPMMEAPKMDDGIPENSSSEEELQFIPVTGLKATRKSK